MCLCQFEWYNILIEYYCFLPRKSAFRNVTFMFYIYLLVSIKFNSVNFGGLLKFWGNAGWRSQEKAVFSEYFCSYSVTFESNLIIQKSSEIEQYFQIIN